MRAREMKDGIYAQFARIGKALSAPKRIELLELLVEQPRTVEALARAAAISVANASQHLQALRRARLVDARKQGLFVEYRVADDQVRRFLLTMRRLAEARLAEIHDIIRRYLKGDDSLAGVPAGELLRRAREGEVTVLDVRPAAEYRAGHIPGARSLPLAELERRIAELPRNRQIVAYCGGQHCVMAVEAVKLLRDRGFRAWRLKESYEDWRASGGRPARAQRAARAA